jgi:large subunit ribosomal protein L35
VATVEAQPRTDRLGAADFRDDDRSFRKDKVSGNPKGLSKHSETSKMPKLKTKSGAKKRFKVTANGHIKSAQAGKRHGMIKRTTKFIRKARGTTVLSKPDEIIIKKNFLPYA